jgi:hypothetical protein
VKSAPDFDVTNGRKTLKKTMCFGVFLNFLESHQTSSCVTQKFFFFLKKYSSAHHGLTIELILLKLIPPNDRNVQNENTKGAIAEELP